MKTKTYSQETKEEAVRLYQAGVAVQEIAEKSGTTNKSLVYGWLKQLGVAARSPGRGGRPKQSRKLPAIKEVKALSPSPLVYSGKLSVDAFDKPESLRVYVVEGDAKSVAEILARLGR